MTRRELTLPSASIPGPLTAKALSRHVAGVEDYQVALASYRAACERWPGTPITFRQGARVIEDSRRLRVVSSQ
jgi:hypothetical protein